MKTKKPTQQNIAKFLGVDHTLLSRVRRGEAFFGKPSAKIISERTKLPEEYVAYNQGQNFYNLLKSFFLKDKQR